jgi:hypothetical protein
VSARCFPPVLSTSLSLLTLPYAISGCMSVGGGGVCGYAMKVVAESGSRCVKTRDGEMEDGEMERWRDGGWRES